MKEIVHKRYTARALFLWFRRYATETASGGFWVRRNRDESWSKFVLRVYFVCDKTGKNLYFPACWGDRFSLLTGLHNIEVVKNCINYLYIFFTASRRNLHKLSIFFRRFAAKNCINYLYIFSPLRGENCIILPVYFFRKKVIQLYMYNFP